MDTQPQIFIEAPLNESHRRPSVLTICENNRINVHPDEDNSRPHSAKRKQKDLQDCIRPLLYVTRLGGGHLVPAHWAPYGFKRRAFRAYCVVCTLVAILAAARFLFLFTYTDDMVFLIDKISVFTTYSQAAIYCGVSLHAWPKLLPVFSVLVARSRVYASYRQRLHATTRWLLALALVVVSVCTGIFLYFVYRPTLDEEIRTWAIPWHDDDAQARLSLTLLLLLMIPGITVILSVEALFILFAYVVYKEFAAIAIDIGHLTKAARREPSDDNMQIVMQVHRYRRFHFGLSEVVEKADRIFSPFIGLALPSFVFTVCLTLYNLSQPDVSDFSVFYLILVAAVEIQHVFVFATGSIIVTSATTKPLRALFRLALYMTVDQTRELELFIEQIHSLCIGFTAYGVYHMGKDLLITIIGALITYTVIVFQFQFPSPEKVHPTLCPAPNMTNGTVYSNGSMCQCPC